MRLRLIADSNIQRSTVVALRADEHDVIWIMERRVDPGDEVILAEAHKSKRIVISVDRDFGRLVFAEKLPHCGVVLLDETPRAGVQLQIVQRCLRNYGEELLAGAFLRVAADGRVRRQTRAPR